MRLQKPGESLTSELKTLIRIPDLRKAHFVTVQSVGRIIFSIFYRLSYGVYTALSSAIHSSLLTSLQSMYGWSLLDELCIMHDQRTERTDIPPRSSIAATQLYAGVQPALRGLWSGSSDFLRWGASSVGRALRSQRRGRGFNSRALHQTVTPPGPPYHGDPVVRSKGSSCLLDVPKGN